MLVGGLTKGLTLSADLKKAIPTVEKGTIACTFFTSLF